MKEQIQALAVATGNRHKIEEIRAVLAPLGINVLSAREAGAPEGFDPEETGATFEANAHIKANALADVLRRAGAFVPVLADDSGLEVDALGGAPGIYSARFADMEPVWPHGPEDGDRAAIEKLLSRMRDVPKARRAARFVCVITVIFPDGGVLDCRGTCAGRIGFTPAGENGFGYDPVFIPDAYAEEGRTFAELPPDEKNAISHRARALARLRENLYYK